MKDTTDKTRSYRMKNAKHLKCPNCGKNLFEKENILTCGKHCFDIAKEGYVNLCIHGKADSGDSKEMIASRRNFLDKEFYKPVLDELCSIVEKYMPDSEENVILDMGCGEGYYLGHLQKYLEKIGKDTECYGFDLSKYAVRTASKKYGDVNWMVANVADVPMQDKSCGIVLSMFANVTETETNRIIKDNGILILVRAGLSHLLEMRKIIYPEIHERYSPTVLPENYELLEKRDIKFNIHMTDGNDMKNLLMMTPHYWKVKEENRQKLYNTPVLDTTAEIEYYILKKD